MSFHSQVDLSADVMVVGAGIHGAGVAQAAAAAGYSVVVVERKAVAAGTSSKSSKLIHGGLRYLEQGNVHLVRESLREREILLRIAPELVKRVPFLIPVYKNSTRSVGLIRAGLACYTLLAGGRPGTWFHSVPRRRWHQLDGLNTTNLVHVFQYWDAQTDDAQLTEAVLESAQHYDTSMLCPAMVERVEVNEKGCWAAVTHHDEQLRIHTKCCVNAAGPWANQVLQRFYPPLPTMDVENVQGSHLELAGHVQKGCYYLEVPSDRRAVFVMPWRGRTLLGTTEHTYTGDPGDVKPLDKEVTYLLEAFRHYFPEREVQLLDSWSGLRVLPAGGAAFKRSRETQLPADSDLRPRVVSIFGGKLTGYRITAQKVLAKLKRPLPKAKRLGRTDRIELQIPQVEVM